MNTRSSRIIHGVPGPAGEPGVLLLVPPSEALDWDLRNEVASTSRYWMADRQAWWVAAPYASTAAAIVSRVQGAALPVEEPLASLAALAARERPRHLRAGLRRARMALARLRSQLRRIWTGEGAGTL